MSRIITVNGEELVSVAMQRMRDQGLSAVLVEPDTAGHWGIMTESDVVKKIINANRSPSRLKVSEIASRPLLTISQDASLHETSGKLVEAHVRRVVVELDGVPTGIVSDTDLFHTVEEFGWEPED